MIWVIFIIGLLAILMGGILFIGASGEDALLMSLGLCILIAGIFCVIASSQDSKTEDVKHCETMYDPDSGHKIETCIYVPQSCLTKYDVDTGKPYEVCNKTGVHNG
jgi:hypothetical protein